MNRAPVSILIAVPLLLMALASSGCRSEPDFKGQEPLIAFQNPELPQRTRLRAMEIAWEQALEDRADKTSTREALKTLAWSPSTPRPMRIQALELVLADPDEEADSERLVTLMLPPERDMGVVELLSRAARVYKWDDAVPALIRAYARPVQNMAEAERPERIALESLRPGEPVTEVAYAVFVDPPEHQPDRTRTDAWNLLARLDQDGEVRLRMLMSGADGTSDDPLMQDLYACLRDLKTLPLTGDELAWLRRLRDPDNRTNAQWWRQATTAVEQLDASQIRGFRIRHAEPVRFAFANRSQWAQSSRDDLLALLRDRLDDRPRFGRDGGAGDAGLSERLDRWADSLSWGDLLALLLIDDALRQPGTPERLLGQAELDRQDSTSEHGGMIDGADSADAPFRVVLYPPTPGTRGNDRAFVASSDMVRASDRALAHFHFHAQNVRNSRYAGPSDGDLDYAARTGRTCVVLTTLRPGALNADCYLPTTATIDLGELRAP